MSGLRDKLRDILGRRGTLARDLPARRESREINSEKFLADPVGVTITRGDEVIFDGSKLKK